MPNRSGLPTHIVAVFPRANQKRIAGMVAFIKDLMVFIKDLMVFRHDLMAFRNNGWCRGPTANSPLRRRWRR